MKWDGTIGRDIYKREVSLSSNFTATKNNIKTEIEHIPNYNLICTHLLWFASHKLGQAVICFYIFQSRQTIKWVWNLPWEAMIVSGCLTWHSFCFRLIGSLPLFHFATSCGEQSDSFSPRGLNLQLCQEKQWVFQNSRQCAPLRSCGVFTIVK